MEQNNLFGSDSTKWNQSETTKKFSDSMDNGVKTITKQKLPNVDSSSILSEQTKVETTMSKYVSELSSSILSEQTKVETTMSKFVSELKYQLDFENIVGYQTRGETSRINNYFPHWAGQLCPTTESSSYPTTADGKEDRVMEYGTSSRKIGTALTSREQIRLITGATASAEQNNYC